MPKPALTIQNYPPTEPFRITLRIRKPDTNVEWSVAVRDYSCWEAACRAAGAALPKLLPANEHLQHQSTIDAYRRGAVEAGRAPYFTMANGEFTMSCFPKAWEEWTETGLSS